MNALPKLQPITAKVLTRDYSRWDLVRMGDMDAWIAANREAIRARYNDFAQERDSEPTPFELFCRVQWDMEVAHFEELKAETREPEWNHRSYRDE